MNTLIYIVNAFTKDGKGGNPAGVVLDAEGLNEEMMQHIASEVGLSETAFVSNFNGKSVDVRFFTPTSEIEFCGHATLALFHVLKSAKNLAVGEYSEFTQVGEIKVIIAQDGMIVMQQNPPQFQERFAIQEIAEMLNVEENIITDTTLPIQVVTTGLRDVLVPVCSGSLNKIIPNDELIFEFSKKHDLVGLHVFEIQPPNSEYAVSCRNFAPYYGIQEESATGSSTGALACYLSHYVDNVPGKLKILQGQAMGLASELFTWVNKEQTSAYSVQVGGFAEITEKSVFRSS